MLCFINTFTFEIIYAQLQSSIHIIILRYIDILFKIIQIGGEKMDILNGFIDGANSKSKDIILGILILFLVLGSEKNIGFNFLNSGNGNGKRKTHHRKYRGNTCNSQGG